MAAGHRKRLRDLVEKAGLENLSKYQQMEYILFYILPRVNTTEIAHELIDTFGSVYGVLNAPAAQLQNIKGLGVDSAMQLSHFIQIFDLYNFSKNTVNRKLTNAGQVATLFSELIGNKSEEYIYALALTKGFDYIGCRMIAHGSEDSVCLDQFKLINFASTSRSKHIIICHNHPHCTCEPSKRDLSSTKALQQLLTSVGINLIDSIIVGTNGTFSFREKHLIDYNPDKPDVIDYCKRNLLETLID